MISAEMLARNLRNMVNRPLILRLFDGYEENRDGLPTINEVNGGGYKPVALTLSDWDIQKGSPAIATSAVREFRFDGTGGQTRVLGAYITDASGEIVWLNKFPDGPIPIGRRGDIIPVRPVWKLGPIS